MFFQQVLEYWWPFFAGALDAYKIAFPLLLGLTLLELLFPAQRLTPATVAFNLIYAPVGLSIAWMVSAKIAAGVNPHLPTFGLWQDFQFGWNFVSVVLLFIYLLAFDFLYYWLHRAQHRFPLLWRYHLLHHSDNNVSASTSARHHWMEEPLRYFFIGIPIAFLYGQQSKVPVPFLMAIGLSGFYLHWNTKLKLAWLERWVVTPRFHRIHHSVEERHFDKNFAVLFPIWDRLFGTYSAPVDGEKINTGVTGLRAVNGLEMALPFPLILHAKRDSLPAAPSTSP